MFHGRLLFALGVVVLPAAVPLPGQQPAEWRIPATLRLRDKIEALDAADLNRWLEPFSAGEIAAGQCEQCVLSGDGIRPEWWDPAVPATLHNQSLSQGALVYLQKNWELRWRDRREVKLCVRNPGAQPLALVPAAGKDKKEFRLPAGKFTIEISTAEVRADLLLPPESMPALNNPVTIVQRKAPARGWWSDGLVDYRIAGDAGMLKSASRAAVLFLEPAAEAAPGVAPGRVRVIHTSSMEIQAQQGQNYLTARVNTPSTMELEGFRLLSRHIWAMALVTQPDGAAVQVDELVLAHPRSSLLMGALVSIGFLALISLTRATRNWTQARQARISKLSLFEQIGRFPFYLAMTPLGRYSISLTQVVFWTLLVVFGFAYVYFSRNEFLALSAQMMGLLGISAGTALSSRVIAGARVRPIPDKYFDAVKRDRIPRFRDLISVGDTPNIFKFQILVFTLIAGALALREILRTGNFPVLQENLLTLMGLSGGAYLANELATDSDWKEIDQWLDAIANTEKKLADIRTEEAQLRAELTHLQQQPDPAKVQDRMIQIGTRLAVISADIKANCDAIAELDGKLTNRLVKMYSEPGAPAPAAPSKP